MTQKSTPFIIGFLAALSLCLGMALYVDRAEAQSRALGPFMIMHHANTTASPGVFRVNQSTGYMSYCYVDNSGKAGVVCTPEVP